MSNARILGSGSFVPRDVYPNSWFDSHFDKPVGPWLEENLHIRQRHWCAPEESTLDLSEKAALDALQNTGIAATELDLIILATDTPEVLSPATSTALQYRLGAKNAVTFDLNNACAGFINGLDIAGRYLQTDPEFKKIMVIGVYAISKFLNLKDKKTSTIFGDGAAALILGGDNGSAAAYLGSKFATDGSYFDFMGIYAGGSKHPYSEMDPGDPSLYLQVLKRYPDELNPDTWLRLILDLSRKTGIQPDDIDHFFFTQINIQSILLTLEKLGISPERSHNIMDRYAYTGAACLPMAFHDANLRGKIKTGNLVLFTGSGAGASFGTAAFRM